MKKGKKNAVATYYARASSLCTGCLHERTAKSKRGSTGSSSAASGFAKPVQQEGKRLRKIQKIALISEFTSGTHAAQYITGVTKAAKKQEYSYPFLIQTMINPKWLLI